MWKFTMNRRSAILASLAGTALWAQAFDSQYSYSATPQKDDEDGYLRPEAEEYVCAKDWDAVLQKAKNCQEAIRDGKVVLANSYFGPPLFYVRNPALHTALTQPPAKDDVFYSYACPRLSGFLWSDFFTLPPKHPAQVLYKIRIGKPLAVFDEVDGACVRRFEQGVVAVNPLEEAKQVQIKAGGLSGLNDVFEQKVLDVSGDGLSLELPGQSGRVYCSCPA